MVKVIVLLQEPERFEKRYGILSAGQTYGHAITVTDHVEPLDRFANFSQ